MKRLSYFVLTLCLLVMAQLAMADQTVHEPSLGELQKRAMDKDAASEAGNVAGLHYLQHLYRHAMQVFAKGVASIQKDGIKLKPAPQLIAEAEKDYDDAQDGGFVYKVEPTSYSPYINQGYTGAKGEDMWTAIDPSIDLKGGESVSLHMPFGPTLRTPDDINSDETKNQLGDDGKPLSTCTVTVAWTATGVSVPDVVSPAYSCEEFLKGKYDAEIVASFASAVRAVLVADQ